MLFQSKVIEARKYIPMVTQALKQLSLVRSLVPELVQRVMQVNSVVLSSDQFDILVKIINSSVTDNKTAMALLPVSTIMYRLDFWKSALYSAVQAELVRIYAELELTDQDRTPPKTGSQRVTVGDRPEDNIDLADPLEPEIGEITLRSRQRLRSSDPSALRAMRRTALSKSMRMRMRASVVLPDEEREVLKEDLLDFISRFLRMVELELNFEFNRHGKIRGQMKDQAKANKAASTGRRDYDKLRNTLLSADGWAR
ncbi:Myotubularin-related protein 5 [Geodia barretti]|uniref:Myotubularin-related protein 5 n=1 Tax=Geodia barretti TaxID=519541 RepID=A0AA35TU69_GEOBA|nr:Myotubularin-related protein 5 [Geodia barretti]